MTFNIVQVRAQSKASTVPSNLNPGIINKLLLYMSHCGKTKDKKYMSIRHTCIITMSQNPARSPLVGLLPLVSPIPCDENEVPLFQRPEI